VECVSKLKQCFLLKGPSFLNATQHSAGPWGSVLLPGCRKRAGTFKAGAASPEKPPRGMSSARQRSIPSVFTWLERLGRTFRVPQAHTFPAGRCWSPRGCAGGWPSSAAPLLLRRRSISALSWRPQQLEGMSAVSPISGDGRSLSGPHGPLARLRTISLPLGMSNGVNPTHHTFGCCPPTA